MLTMTRSTRLRRGPLAAITFAALLLAGPARADGNWPRQFDSSSGSFIIYQPQPESVNGDLLNARAAFSLQRTADAEPVFGVLWFTERIQIDRDSSTVDARDFDVTKVRLPNITSFEASRYEKLVEAEAVKWDLSGSLEELQAGLASAEKERASVADLDNTPPRILFTQQRAILVVYDGPPAFEPIEDTKLERVSNSPFAVVHDPARRRYFLSGAHLWYTAQDPLGPWSVILNPPPDVAAVVPVDTVASDQIQGAAPGVFTAIAPTELIATDGPPQYAPLVGDELLYITNTESDVVREVSTQELYVLLSGRWYKAARTDGPWTFVRGDQLPASFAKIPPDSPKANLLASVAGTDQADDAVADAEIPQTSAIRRDASGFTVFYDGPPQFERIAGTDMQYVTNADIEVIFAGGRYYACDQGVWYVADDPEGPWQVSDLRPVGVDDIPPSCPVYDVRYVYIYNATPDYIYFGYLPGYLGCYPYYGTVVYGTGYYYRPWHHHHFYPRPWTWGFYPRYNPWLSRWSFGFSYGAGFLRIGYQWHSAPQMRGPLGPPRWFGPGGYRRPLLDEHFTMVRTRRRAGPELRPGERTPMNLYRRSLNIGRVDRNASRLPLRPVVKPAEPPPTVPNNVFAGRDGKVYRRDEGGWKVNQSGAWTPTPAPASRPTSREPSGGGAPGAPAKSWPRPVPAQPMPGTPVPSREQPRIAPTPRPAPPKISPAPGDLEREFRGRARATNGPPPVRVPPQSPPRGPEREKKQGDHKR